MQLFCVLPNTPIVQSLAVFLLKLVHACGCLQRDFKSNCPREKAASGLAVCLKAVDFCCWEPTCILHRKWNVSFAVSETGGLGIGQEGKARLQQCSTFGLRLSLACGPCPYCWSPKLGCRAHWVRWELAGVLHQLWSLWHAEGWNGKWQCYSNPSLKFWVAVSNLDWSASPQRLPVCKAVNSTSLS